MVKVKICGLTSVDEALVCAQAGVDWIGLNFHPSSQRQIDLETAAAIVSALPVSCTPVGLFVNRPTDDVRAVASRVGLNVVQLHGDETPEDVAALAPLNVVRAFRIKDSESIAAMLAYFDRTKDLGQPCSAILVDAFVSGMAGGTGTAISDSLLSQLPLPRLILAGGLTPENVAERVSIVRPWMVDVASGVESSPGRKDPERVRAFIHAAQSA